VEEAMTTPRRGFLKSLAAVPLAPAAIGSQAAPAPAPPTGAAPHPPTGHEAVAEALAEAVKREFGAHLDAADLEAVKKELTRNLDDASRLRAAASLRNADGPVNLFTARPPALPERGGRR
jgi:hypothetical protein